MKITRLLSRLRAPTPTVPPCPPPAAPEVAAPAGPIHAKSRRERILEGLNLLNGHGAEIGPLHNPLVAKDDGDVLYVDHCDTKTLRAIWSKDPSVDVSRLQVDVVWRDSSLCEALQASSRGCQAGDRLDYVVASHVIEHVPDLIRWLSEIQHALKADGQLRLAVPDRRFTFDYFRQGSTLADLLAAHLAGARVPSAACILDHTLNMVNVDLAAAWRGEIETTPAEPVYAYSYCIDTARDALANGSYHDFHCWVFTPQSFIALMQKMAEHDLHVFSCEAFYDTAFHDFEFIVHLRPCADRAARVESWRRAATLPRRYSFARE